MKTTLVYLTEFTLYHRYAKVGLIGNPATADCHIGTHLYLHAYVTLLLRVDVELNSVLAHILDDLHQAAEHLRLQLADQAADRVGSGGVGGTRGGFHHRRDGFWLGSTSVCCN